jgi:hypothetical protein
MRQGQTPQQSKSTFDSAAMAVKSATAGIATAILGLVGSVIYIAIALTVIIAIATFVLGMGDWKLAGTRLSDWLWLALRLSVILTFVNYTLLVPISTINKNASIKKVFHEFIGDADENEQYILNFAVRFFKARNISIIAGSLFSVTIAFFLHDPMMAAIGNPWADLLTIAVMIIGSPVLSALLSFTLFRKLKAEDPNAFETMLQLY